MKKLILFILLHATGCKLNAQVKIGAPGDPDLNAVLELAGTSRGLLLPRLALTGTASATPLSSHTAGMVIYNTATVGNVTPGYYYNDGVRWNRLASSSETWGLNGNATTNPATHFLGTSDATDFTIRTNNLERIRISSSGNLNIGGGLLSDNTRVKIGGSTSGPSAATLGIVGSVSAAADGQDIYSVRNSPNFGTSVQAGNVFGTYTNFGYSGQATGYVVGDYAIVGIQGSNSYDAAAGISGTISRFSTGTADGAFYGGQFGAQATGLGNVNTMFGSAGSAQVYGNDPISINFFGAQSNFVSINNPNATLPEVYGIRNIVQLNTAATSDFVVGLQTTISAGSSGTFLNAYGTSTNFNIFTGGGIFNARGLSLSSIIPSANISNYTGIYIGNIGLTSGSRRVFDYAGSGTNDPFIINYDGSVQIGNTIPVTNAKLSITDGHLQSGQTTKPLISTIANIGTGGTATLIDATDVAGIISLNMGTGAYGPGTIAIITFNKIYQTPPIVIITPANINAATGMVNQRPYITTGTSGFNINFALAATLDNTMLFNYQVIETVNN